MITWQDPVALGLAASLVAGAWWLRRWLVQRGAASHCQQCAADSGATSAGTGESPSAPPPPAKPVVIAPSQLRIGRPRR